MWIVIKHVSSRFVWACASTHNYVFIIHVPEEVCIFRMMLKGIDRTGDCDDIALQNIEYGVSRIINFLPITSTSIPQIMTNSCTRAARNGIYYAFHLAALNSRMVEKSMRMKTLIV